jgi:hypothetical protein
MHFLLTIPFLLLSQDPNQVPRVGITDFYGLRTTSQADVQKVIAYRGGASINGSDREIEKEIDQPIQKLKALPSVADAAMEVVCCDRDKSMIYVGIPERNGRSGHFLDEP